MKVVISLLGLLCGLLSLFWGLVWTNNVHLSWIKRIWALEAEAAAQTHGWLPLLDLFCIDHSTVSTFIPFFGFAWLARSFFQIHCRVASGDPIQQGAEFPFFSGYNEWMVALGLMGTVWGLIMIGFFPDLDDLSIVNLIEALRTALFSTLVALVWVYIFVLRIVRPSLQSLVHRWLGQPPATASVQQVHNAVASVTTALQRLNAALADTTRRIDDIQHTVSAEKMQQVANWIDTADAVLAGIKASGERTGHLLQTLQHLLDKQVSLSRRQADRLETIATAQADQVATLAAIHQSLIVREASDAAGQKRWRKLIDLIKTFDER